MTSLSPSPERSSVDQFPFIDGPAVRALDGDTTSLPAFVDVTFAPLGKWTPHTMMVDAFPMMASVVPVVGHAGPEAGRHLDERPVGASAVSAHGRRPRPLTDDEWTEISAQHRDAIQLLGARGFQAIALSVDNDGLLAHALSPRSNPTASEAARIQRVVDVCRPALSMPHVVGVMLTVEERVPGGIDATLGVRAAKALVDAGARFIVASVGTGGEPRLLVPTDVDTDTQDPFLTAARWVSAAVAVPVWAAGPTTDAARAHRRARAFGLAGVVASSLTFPTMSTMSTTSTLTNANGTNR